MAFALTAWIGVASAEEYDAKAEAALIIGPEGTDQACVNCHARETEAWKETTHYATFKLRHRSKEAAEVQKNLGIKSMKREGVCLECHYTSVLVRDRVTPQWGVSCESCHAPGSKWNDIHNKVGGDPKARTLKWGEGKKESEAERAKRIQAAATKGMIHSRDIYGIATNCVGCHTVPNETLVNKGQHKAGSDFDLVAWSQGEVRHNFLSSPGAPDNPTNRPAGAEEKRLLYVIGAMVDLETSLRNLGGVKEKGGAFHKAMVERVNRARKKVDAILKASDIPVLSAAVKALPASVDDSSAVTADAAKKLGEATKKFAEKPSGDLAALDKLMPSEVKGKPHE
ncbi:MAG: multiheme c-type cytochrome [Candidatus Binatia bacterium]